MKSISKVVLSVLMTSVVGAVIYFQRQELRAEKEKNTSLTKERTERDTVIQQLREAEEKNKKRLVQLHSESQRITQTLTKREATIEQLHHANQQIQSWADTRLPDAIIRLRNRGAATGAVDYHPNVFTP